PGLCAFAERGRTWDPRRQLLLEAFAPGREFSVEGFVDRGELVVLMIQENLRFERDGGMRYETANVSPADITADEEEMIGAAVGHVLAALGVDGTFVHVELKWDGRTLNVVEVN